MTCTCMVQCSMSGRPLRAVCKAAAHHVHSAAHRSGVEHDPYRSAGVVQHRSGAMYSPDCNSAVSCRSLLPRRWVHNAARRPHSLSQEPSHSSTVQPVRLQCHSLHLAVRWNQVIDCDMHTVPAGLLQTTCTLQCSRRPQCAAVQPSPATCVSSPLQGWSIVHT